MTAYEVKAGKAYCNGTEGSDTEPTRSPCPVVRECLLQALRSKEWGVWGGLTKAERDRCVTEDYDLEDVMAQYDAGTLEERVVLRGR